MIISCSKGRTDHPLGLVLRRAFLEPLTLNLAWWVPIGGTTQKQRHLPKDPESCNKANTAEVNSVYVTAPFQNQPVVNLDLQATNQCLQLRKPRDTSTAVVPHPCTSLDYTASQMTLINPSSSTKGLNDHTPNITSQVFLSLFHFTWSGSTLN